MKKRIYKLCGVGLIVVLLASFAVATPASAAKPLQWNEEVTPSTTGKVLVPDLDILDISVNPDGETIYAACADTNTGDTSILYKSDNGGATWRDISTATGLPTAVGYATQFVACAPDDPDLVVVVDGTSGNVSAYVSDDGGVEFNNLTFTPANALSITDVDVSAAAGGKNFVAISGRDNNGLGEVWYRNLGLGSWVIGSTLDGYNTRAESGNGTATNALALAFSPNFASDQVLTAVTVNSTATGFEMLSVSTTQAASTWNEAAGFNNYPVSIEKEEGTPLTTFTAASIALAPTYLGGDEVERVAFVGLQNSTTGNAGVYRLEDYTDKVVLSGKQIYSVAYDGVTCLGGETDTTVWRSSDPLSTIPTFYATATTKAPGGASNPVLGWLGTTAVAATAGNESAFSISVDDGKSFNDISLIDTSITAVSDLALSDDGSIIYLLTNDNHDSSLWRMSSTWQRVLSAVGKTGYIVRIAPDNPDVVYVACRDSADNLYYSKEGGDTKWYQRASVRVADLAVESENVAYIAQANDDTVSKTINAGFTWGPAEDTELVSGNIYTIASIGEDMVVVGGTAGYVSYSTDGNDSWTKIIRQIGPLATNVRVTADGLDTGGNIYAGTDFGLYRWTIGTPATEPWAQFEAPQYLEDADDVIPFPVIGAITGVVLQSGALYASTTARNIEDPTDGTTTENAVYRHTAPFLPDPPPPADAISAGTRALDTAPTALRVTSTDYSNKIWVVDTAYNVLYSYDDTLLAVVPMLIGPADDTKVSINPLSGEAYDVNFTWNSVTNISMGDSYGLLISLDEMGDEAVTPAPDGMSVGGVPGPVVSVLVGPSIGGTSADGHVVYMAGTKYYWKVRVTAPIKSPWSELRSFTIEAGGAVVPEIGAPPNGGTVYETPAFSWSPVAGATKYRFQLSEDTVFAVPIYTADVISTGIKPDLELELGTYFWRVMALEPVPGDWSTIANFTVAVPVEAVAPEIVVPAQPAPTVNVPEIKVPAPEVVVQPAPVTEPTISEGLLWAVIIIGAVLVIALIVLIVRTRRSV